MKYKFIRFAKHCILFLSTFDKASNFCQVVQAILTQLSYCWKYVNAAFKVAAYVHYLLMLMLLFMFLALI